MVMQTLKLNQALLLKVREAQAWGQLGVGLPGMLVGIDRFGVQLA
jgi:hypothetical protein